MRWYICIWPSIQRSLYAAWSSEAYQECLQTYAMRNHKLLFMCIAWRKAWHYNGLYSFIKFQETWFRNLKENRQSKNALFWKETLWLENRNLHLNAEWPGYPDLWLGIFLRSWYLSGFMIRILLRFWYLSGFMIRILLTFWQLSGFMIQILLTFWYHATSSVKLVGTTY